MRASHTPVSRLAIAVLVTAVLVACGPRAEPAPEPDRTPDEPAIGAFAPMAGILEQSCATTGCHTAAQAAGQLVLSPDVAHGNTVNAPSAQLEGEVLVVPGDPDTSYLLAKIRGDERIRGARMPIGRSPLTAEEEQIIADWIAAGAPE